MKKLFKIVFFVLLMIALGYFRENLFVGINLILYNKFYHLPNPAFGYLSFIDNYPYSTIYTAKWFITPLFTSLFWLVQRQSLLKKKSFTG